MCIDPMQEYLIHLTREHPWSQSCDEYSAAEQYATEFTCKIMLTTFGYRPYLIKLQLSLEKIALMDVSWLDLSESQVHETIWS